MSSEFWIDEARRAMETLRACFDFLSERSPAALDDAIKTLEIAIDMQEGARVTIHRTRALQVLGVLKGMRAGDENGIDN